MGRSTSATGLTISKMASGRSLGPTEQSTKESIRTAKNMEKDYSCGETIAATTGISAKITLMVKVNTVGRMEEFMKANGLTIKWKATEFLLGLMGESTKDST